MDDEFITVPDDIDDDWEPNIEIEPGNEDESLPGDTHEFVAHMMLKEDTNA